MAGNPCGAGGTAGTYYLLDTNALFRLWNDRRDRRYLGELGVGQAGAPVFVLYDRVVEQFKRVVGHRNLGSAGKVLKRIRDILGGSSQVQVQGNVRGMELNGEVDECLLELGIRPEFEKRHGRRRNDDGLANGDYLEPVDRLLLAAYLLNEHLTLLTFDRKLVEAAGYWGDRRGRRRMIKEFRRRREGGPRAGN